MTRTEFAIEPVGEVAAELGEGPYWDESTSTLLWVDIPAGLLHRTDASTGHTDTADEGAPLSAALPAAGGGVLLARKHQLILRKDGHGDQVVARAAGQPDTVRFNDASVDPDGRVWVGSMDIAETDPLGVLYRLVPGGQHPGGQLDPVVTGMTVSNGIGWSPDQHLMYYIDSPTRRVDVFTYYPEAGGLSARRRFADLSGAGGFPDGLTVDADGCVWVAVWAGGVLHRYTPAGQLDTVVTLPVSHPTSAAFGGEGLRDLFVTTAREPLSAAERAAQPLAGRLLRLSTTGAAGLPAASAKAVLLT
jgi:sugar lactone lactonase YvrE